jgi:hypothetical protein
MIGTVAAATAIILGLLFPAHPINDLIVTLPNAVFGLGLILGFASLVFGLVAYTRKTFSIAIPLHPATGRPAQTWQDYLGSTQDQMVGTWIRELSEVLFARDFERGQKERAGWLRAQTVSAALTLVAVVTLPWLH